MSCAPKRIFFALPDGQPAFRLIMLNLPYLQRHMCQLPFPQVQSAQPRHIVTYVHVADETSIQSSSPFAPFTDFSGRSQPDRIVASQLKGKRIFAIVVPNKVSKLIFVVKYRVVHHHFGVELHISSGISVWLRSNTARQLNVSFVFADSTRMPVFLS